jgi:hypothetical protein
MSQYVKDCYVRRRPYDERVSTVGRSLSRRHQRLLPGYVAAVVLGILGMHALVQHCPAPSHVMSVATTAPMASGHLSSGHVAQVLPAVDASVDGARLTEQPASSLSDMLMLCAAMLLGAGAVLMLLLLRQGYRRGLSLARRRICDWRPPVAIAGTGPPTACAFAVIRC